MYLYYTMAALGLQRYLWWKKYLTQMQLAQFVIFGIYGAFFFTYQTGFPKVFNYMGISQPIIFFYMFASFYRTAYIRRQQQQLLKEQELYQQQQLQQQNGLTTKVATVNGVDKTQ